MASGMSNPNPIRGNVVSEVNNNANIGNFDNKISFETTGHALPVR
jgi:hypothetical protein